MIIRFIVIDPRPRKGETDMRVYQLPENSREQELLSELCDAAQLEWAIIGATRTRKRRTNDS